MLNQQFVHNKNATSIIVLEDDNLKIQIPIGGKIPVTDEEAKYISLKYSNDIRRGWITVEKEKSSTKAPKTSEGIVLAEDPMKGSLTFPVIEPKAETVTSTKIGATAAVEVEEKPKKRNTKAK